MTPLPESFKSGTAFWERMEPQPDTKDLGGFTETEFDDAPYTAGDTLYRREEWRVERVFGDEFTVHFRNGECVDLGMVGFKNYQYFVDFGEDWQPASTMPSWLAEHCKHYTVVSVEATTAWQSKRYIGNIQTPSKSIEANDWGWYVTVEAKNPV